MFCNWLRSFWQVTTTPGISGTGVTTWNERLWTGVGRAELLVDDTAAGDADELGLSWLGVLIQQTLPEVKAASSPAKESTYEQYFTA